MSYSLSKEKSLKYYQDENYRKEINNKYKKISLNLSNCYSIKDVSMLGYKVVHTLDLSDCFNITDVSMLGSLYELNLSSCNKIKDVSNSTIFK